MRSDDSLLAVGSTPFADTRPFVIASARDAVVDGGSFSCTIL